MRSFLHCLAPVLLVATISGCLSAPMDSYTLDPDPELLHSAVHKLTDVMMETVTSPPVSSRTYAYTSIAAYEVLRHGNPEYSSFAGQLHRLDPIPTPDRETDVLLPFSSLIAFLTVAEALVFQPDHIASHRDRVVGEMRARGVPRRAVSASVSYGESVGRHILEWAATDNIKTARAMPRFVVENEPGRWQPTPPAYMAGVEPNWAVLRPFVMHSASEFRPPPPTPFEMRDGSPFHAEVLAVYEARRDLTDEQREIAAFWDCNPYALRSEGHFMFAEKKLSPGGHWMGIAEIALRETDGDIMRTAEAYSKVAITLADAFISVWEEKYRSNLIRPETVINRALDPEWRPVLQTPPFPEYPSGHSVVSTAAAEVLTSLFGDGFAFDDTTEVPFGLPVRSFSSFREAAAEAAISRLYGGIHYPMGIEHGVTQGRKLGEAVVARIRTQDAGLAAMQ